MKREQNVKGFLADLAQAPVLIRATKSSFENKMKILRNIFPPEFDISRFLIESTVSSIEKGNMTQRSLPSNEVGSISKLL